VSEKGRWLGQVVRGYLAYRAVPTNSQAITPSMHYVTWHWKRALGRRSQKGHVTWARMAPIAARWLPPARVQHSYPQQRFIFKHPRWEPSALAAHARICPGGRGVTRVPTGMGARVHTQLRIQEMEGVSPKIRMPPADSAPPETRAAGPPRRSPPRTSPGAPP
jgi:hypothetical protein